MDNYFVDPLTLQMVSLHFPSKQLSAIMQVLSVGWTKTIIL